MNLSEFAYTPGAVEILLDLGASEDLHTIPEEPKNLEEPESDSNSSITDLRGNVHYHQRGQPSIVSKFPDLVCIAAEFVKQHGFSAQFRRRTETGYSPGVTIPEIRDHLLKEVSGLRDYGISFSTTRRLFQAPDKGNKTSRRYQCLIDARIGIKSNCYREYHPYAHYLFSRNKHRREFCSLFQSESCIISMDDMAKLKVGAPAVSRYHNIRWLFATSDAPNYKDHDFPVPNYLLSVSGYMILEDHTFDNTSTASTAVNDVECNTSDNTYDKSLEVNNNGGGKIEDTYGVTVKANENSNFWSASDERKNKQK